MEMVKRRIVLFDSELSDLVDWALLELISLFCEGVEWVCYSMVTCGALSFFLFEVTAIKSLQKLLLNGVVQITKTVNPSNVCSHLKPFTILVSCK